MYVASNPFTKNQGCIDTIDASAPQNDCQAVPADKSTMLNNFIQQFMHEFVGCGSCASPGPMPPSHPKAARPDGKIGNFSQGHIGDCFALTALYATAQTSAGRQKIKDSITKTGNGVYSVQFAGDPSHQTFTVTQAEVNKARAAKQASTGDPDVAIFELAIGKYEELHGKSTSGGNTGQALQLLNGQPVVETKPHDTAAARELIHEAAMNPGGFILTLGSGVNKSTGQPANHETDPASSPRGHAFTVTSIDEKAGTATLANPWDTKKVYTISIEDLASIGKLFSVPNAASA